MAKYVFDFSEVNKIASNIKNLADDIELDEWKTKLDAMGNGWKGKASEKFLSRIDGKAYDNMARMKKALLNLEDYLYLSAKNINRIEEDIASLDI